MSSANATYLVMASTQAMPLLMETDREPFLWNGSLGNDVFQSALEAKGLANTSGDFSAAELAGISTSDFIASSTTFSRQMLSSSSNVSIDEVSVAYNRFDLSDSVAFNSLTLGIPTTTISKHGVKSIEADYMYYCILDGCCLPYSIPGKNVTADYHHSKNAFVNAIGICINADGSADLRVNYSAPKFISNQCNQRSNTSMLLVGVGRRIAGDTLDVVDAGYEIPMLKLGGVRMVYSVTFGLLSWTIEDLNATFNTTCDVDLDCHGVHFPLDASRPEGSDVLVVQKAKLPLNDLDYFSLDYYLDSSDANTLHWKQLVHFYLPRLSKTDELVLPRRFKNITQRAWAFLRNFTNYVGSVQLDNFMSIVEKNHLYAEESLQMTYTAGVFNLFSQAVRQQRLTNASTLAFAGNTHPLHVQASIPQLNVIISLTGVAIALAAAIGIAILHKRTSRTIESSANVEVVAEAMFNRAKYPIVFLDMTLREVLEKSSPAEHEVLLQNLPVQRVELVSVEAEGDCRESKFTVNESLV